MGGVGGCWGGEGGVEGVLGGWRGMGWGGPWPLSTIYINCSRQITSVSMASGQCPARPSIVRWWRPICSACIQSWAFTCEECVFTGVEGAITARVRPASPRVPPPRVPPILTLCYFLYHYIIRITVSGRSRFLPANNESAKIRRRVYMWLYGRRGGGWGGGGGRYA